MLPHREGPRHREVSDGRLSSKEMWNQRQNEPALTNLLSRTQKGFTVS